MCDVIILQMENRFSCLQTAQLFNSQLVPKYSEEFPVDVPEIVCSAYPFLDQTRLKTEFEVIYSRPDFHTTLLLHLNLNNIFPETIQILK